MTGSDWVQVSIALTAISGVLIAMVNAIIMKQQLKNQHEQWKYSVKPVFKIIKAYHLNNSFEWAIFIENTNEIFHQIQGVSFSSERINISNTMHGILKLKNVDDTDVYQGTSLVLTPQTNDFVCGNIKLEGIDLVGNRFEVMSNDIKFENGYIINHSEFDYKYFRFIK